MPYEIKKDTKQCPKSKPWAIRNTVSGDANGRCFKSHDAALPQQRLLMAKVARGEIAHAVGNLVTDSLARLKKR